MQTNLFYFILTLFCSYITWNKERKLLIKILIVNYFTRPQNNIIFLSFFLFFYACFSVFQECIKQLRALRYWSLLGGLSLIETWWLMVPSLFNYHHNSLRAQVCSNFFSASLFNCCKSSRPVKIYSEISGLKRVKSIL